MKKETLKANLLQLHNDGWLDITNIENADEIVNRLAAGNTGEEGTNDAAIIGRADVSVRHRVAIELKVVRRALRQLVQDGYTIHAIDDGEDRTHYPTEREQIDAIFGVDESHIITKKDGKESHVFIVLGNDGYDAISDYGMSLDPSLSKVNDYANELENAGA